MDLKTLHKMLEINLGEWGRTVSLQTLAETRVPVPEGMRSVNGGIQSRVLSMYRRLTKRAVVLGSELNALRVACHWRPHVSTSFAPIPERIVTRCTSYCLMHIHAAAV